MEAKIICYNSTANLFYKDICNYLINYDGFEFEDEEEWNSWADEVLEPAKTAENYDSIKMQLYIATNHKIKG